MDLYDTMVGAIFYISMGVVFFIAILQWIMPELGPETNAVRLGSWNTERLVTLAAILYTIAVVVEFLKPSLNRLLVAIVQAGLIVMGAIVVAVLLDRVIINRQRRRQRG